MVQSSRLVNAWKNPILATLVSPDFPYGPARDHHGQVLSYCRRGGVGCQCLTRTAVMSSQPRGLILSIPYADSVTICLHRAYRRHIRILV